MYLKPLILAKLDELLEYSIAQIPTLNYEEKETFGTYYSSIVSSGAASVNAYYSVDRSNFKKPLNDLGLYLYNELWQRGAKWEDEYDLGLRDDFPESYHDLRKMFYNFDWLMNLSNDAFFKAWSYASPESDDPTMTLPPVPSSNSYISRLCSELVLTSVDPITGEQLTTVIEKELGNVESLATWLEQSMAQSGSVSLWEDQGALLEAPDTRPLAYQIFLDMGLKEAIDALNLPVYIPTYIGSDVESFGGTFPSVAAMKADKSVAVGKYVVISSNDEDNGNLYLKTETEYTFIANICGKDGVTFTPHVDLETRYLTFTNNGGLENPPPIYLGGGSEGEAVNNSFRIKGSVTNYSDLPNDPKIDDMYNIVNADTSHGIKSGDKVVWNGNSWDNCGHIFNFRG